MNIHEIRARTLAVMVGVALFLVVATLPSRWFGDNLLFLSLFDIAIYGIAGLVLGFIWPTSGWRLGLYVAAIWLPMLIIGGFLSWEQPTSARSTLLDLLRYLLIVVVACAGAAVGAMISQSRGVEAKQANNSH